MTNFKKNVSFAFRTCINMVLHDVHAILSLVIMLESREEQIELVRTLMKNSNRLSEVFGTSSHDRSTLPFRWVS